jgi:putative alpha-1,2-mannosidase
MYFDFDTNEGEKIKIKFALSPVSQENALQNMRTEITGWDFEKVKNQEKKTYTKHSFVRNHHFHLSHLV